MRIVWDAGIPPPVARELEQAERDLFRSRVSPDPGARKVRDFTLSAGDGFLVDIPGRPQIAVGKIADAIYMLLGGASRWVDRVPPVVPAGPGLPDTPVRVRIVWDAGITFPVVRELGQAEWDLFRARVRPDPGARKVPDVRRVNFTLSAGDGFVVDSPALPRIAVGKIADAINLLLVRACRAPFLPAELSPLHEPEIWADNTGQTLRNRSQLQGEQNRLGVSRIKRIRPVKDRVKLGTRVARHRSVHRSVHR